MSTEWTLRPGLRLARAGVVKLDPVHGSVLALL